MERAELDAISGWFAGRLPDGWFTGAPSVTADEKQVKVVGTLSEPSAEGLSAEARKGAEEGRIARFREGTRGYRMEIAREAEHRFKLPVQWGAVCGGTSLDFNAPTSGGREATEEARRVMIGWRARRWRGRRGPGFSRRGWSRPADFQGF